jgi:hypothetical protein
MIGLVGGSRNGNLEERLMDGGDCPSPIGPWIKLEILSLPMNETFRARVYLHLEKGRKKKKRIAPEEK